MYYVWHDSATEEKARITEIALEGYQGEKSEEEMNKAIQMENFPSPEYKEGFVVEEYINPKTKEYIYEYVKAPLTPEDEIKQLKKEVLDAQLALAELFESIGGK